MAMAFGAQICPAPGARIKDWSAITSGTKVRSERADRLNVDLEGARARFVSHSYVASRRVHKDKRKEEEQVPAEALASTNAAEVLAMDPADRVEWFQKALMQAATGKLKAEVLYPVIVDPSFSSTKPLKAVVLANLHLFNAKQQKAIKEVQKNLKEAAKAAKPKRSRSRPRRRRRSPSRSKSPAASAENTKQAGSRKRSRSYSRNREPSEEKATNTRSSASKAPQTVRSPSRSPSRIRFKHSRSRSPKSPKAAAREEERKATEVRDRGASSERPRRQKSSRQDSSYGRGRQDSRSRSPSRRRRR